MYCDSRVCFAIKYKMSSYKSNCLLLFSETKPGEIEYLINPNITIIHAKGHLCFLQYIIAITLVFLHNIVSVGSDKPNIMYYVLL